MKRSKRARRVHSQIEFALKNGQSLFVSCGGMIRPGLSRIFIDHKGSKVQVWADATSGSYFLFCRSAKGEGYDFELCNPDYRETLETYLRGQFWSQFNFGELADLVPNKPFNQKINRRIKRLVAEFEARAAKELNAIPRPRRRK